MILAPLNTIMNVSIEMILVKEKITLFLVFKDEFATVDDLSKEEIDEKLGALAAKMDKNGDGEITQEELTMWIHYVQTKYIYDDTERQWEENDKNGDGQITWDEYKEHTYGFLTEEELNQ